MIRLNLKTTLLFAALAFCLCVTSSSQATLIISNIPATPSTPDGETPISNGFQFPSRMRGVSFTTGAAPIHIDSIDYVLHDIGDGPSVEIRVDNAGQPGAGIALPAQSSLTDIGWGSFNRYHYTYASNATVNLNPNTTYWIMGRVSGPFSRWLWEGFNSNTATGSWATIGTSVLDSTNGGGTWGAPVDSLHNLFQINGTLLPEPTSLSMLCLGGMIMLHRKRKH